MPRLICCRNGGEFRLHLDDCVPQSGPLRVLPGSRISQGRLGAGAVAAVRAAKAVNLAVDCLVPAGGAVVMSRCSCTLPHPKTGRRGHRRVIHLEYAAEPLPGGLESFEAALVEL